jgi:prolipoprotein diacylglyceryltransferase
LLWKRYGDRLKPGDLFLAYLIGYPVGRFLLEFLRLDYVPMAGINLNQAIMLATALVSGGVLIWRHRRVRASRSATSLRRQHGRGPAAGGRAFRFLCLGRLGVRSDCWRPTRLL